MKTIVDENLISFKVLEQKIFDYVCELGRLITQQVLENYDKELAQSRDKKLYRGKGKRKTSIKTAYVYLLDKTMQMDKIDLISTNLAAAVESGT